MPKRGSRNPMIANATQAPDPLMMRVLAGEASPEEHRRLKKQLAKDPAAAARFEYWRAAWNALVASRPTKEQAFSTKDAWARLKERLDETKPADRKGRKP